MQIVTGRCQVERGRCQVGTAKHLVETGGRKPGCIEANAGEIAAVDSFVVVCVSVTLVVTVGKPDLALQASF
jgi:hypothetical protein